jgi:hypothetical protein
VRVDDLASLVSPSLVWLTHAELGEERRRWVCCAVGERLVVTCAQAALEAASTPGTLVAELGDGTTAPIIEVAGLDTGRNLILLRVDADLVPLARGGDTLLEPSSHVFLTHGVAGNVASREARIEALHAVGDGLVVYILDGEGDASGMPLIDRAGRLQAVGAAALGPVGPVPLGVPVRYVSSLIHEGTPMPLFMLRKMASRPAVERQVPRHPISLLAGSAPDELRAIALTLADAIQRGAPAYNSGDAAGCYDVYADAARQVVSDHPSCLGASRALAEGLDRAAGLEDVDARAWAMRDAFDGLLAAIERYLSGPPTPTPLPN